MNILYIGPYRDKSIDGLISVNHINSLKKDCSLTIKPIFLCGKNYNKNASLDTDLLFLENKSLLNTKYDICIQHAPIDYLISFKLVANQNYCIPIVRNTIDSESCTNCKIFDNFDTVFYDSQFDLNIIKKIVHNKKKYKLFSYSEPSIEPSTVPSLSTYNKQYKFYTFINEQSHRFINKILISFLLLKKKISISSLIIVIDNENYRKLIQDSLDFLAKQFNIKYINNYISILMLETKEENELAIHKSCDCCIDIKDYTNNSFRSYLAKLYNNSIISNENIAYTEDIDIDNIRDTDQYAKYNPSISSLSAKMQNIINTVPVYNNDNIPTLNKLVCK